MQRIRALAASMCAMLLVSGVAVSHANAQDALFGKLGGKVGIGHIVDESVTLWLGDARIKDDFDNINLDRLKTRLKDQICELAKGPCTYQGRSMAAAHAGLGLNQAKFNALAEDLQTAMDHVGVPYRTQNRLMALLAPMQRDVVTQ